LEVLRSVATAENDGLDVIYREPLPRPAVLADEIVALQHLLADSLRDGIAFGVSGWHGEIWAELVDAWPVGTSHSSATINVLRFPCPPSREFIFGHDLY